MMNPIYQVGDEKDIRAFVAFGDTETGKLFEDADLSVQVEAEEAQNAFEKNMLLVNMGDAGLAKAVDFVDGAVIVLAYTAASDDDAASVAPVALACKAAD